MVDSPDYEETLRREGLGAFSHEIRTPLTSIRMILDLAQPDAQGGGIVLDSELTAMLNTSLRDLQALADDLHDVSRLERGRLAVGSGPAHLAPTLQEVQASLDGIEFAFPSCDGLEGPWDPIHLRRALRDLVIAADHGGAADGRVECRITVGSPLELLLLSGAAVEKTTKSVGADLGFAFFRARHLIRAMGGQLEVLRGDRCSQISVSLPRSG